MNWQYSFVGPAFAWLSGPVIKALGCYSVLPCSKPTTWKPGLYLILGGEASLQRPELPRPPRKVISKRIKNRVSLMKSLFSRKNGVFSFGEGMFPSQKGCSVEKNSASYECLGFFHHHCLQSPPPPPPLKISNRTLEKIPSQARIASSMFFFSCRFLLRLVVLVTDHTKSLESLNRGDRVVVPWYLNGGTWYIHWWNQYQRQWNRYRTWWNRYQFMFICYIITKIQEKYPGRRQVKTLKLAVADAKSSFFKEGLFNGNVLQIR